jgi:chromosomal replication initiation ATPase DnaA
VNAIPTTAEIMARRVRLGWPMPRPVVIPPLVKVEPPAPTRESVKRAIMTLTEMEAPAAWIVLARICAATGVSLTELRGEGRSRPVALARQFAMWMLVRKRGLSLNEAKLHFNRDHTTILHGVRAIDAIMDGRRP